MAYTGGPDFWNDDHVIGRRGGVFDNFTSPYPISPNAAPAASGCVASLRRVRRNRVNDATRADTLEQGSDQGAHTVWKALRGT